jgi:hypothetical protein
MVCPDPSGHKDLLSHSSPRGTSKSLFVRLGEAEEGSLLLALLGVGGLRSYPATYPNAKSSRRGYCAKGVKSAESAPKASDDPEEEQIYRDLWEEETKREVVIDCLKADCAVRTGRPYKGL